MRPSFQKTSRTAGDFLMRFVYRELVIRHQPLDIFLLILESNRYSLAVDKEKIAFNDKDLKVFGLVNLNFSHAICFNQFFILTIILTLSEKGF